MLALITPASLLPVTLDEMKLYLKMDDIDTDDAVITLLLTAAVAQVEAATGRCFINQTWKQTFTNFPVSDLEWQLYRSKVQSITSIKYYDTAGVQQTVSSSIYEIDGQEPTSVRLKYLQTWPAHDGREDGIEVTFVAGYGATAASTPSMIKAVIQIITFWLYENRSGGDYPRETLQALVSSYVVAHVL